MKKSLYIISLLLVLMMFSACSGDGNGETTASPSPAVTGNNPETTEAVSDDVHINIKKELIVDVETFKNEISVSEGITFSETDDMLNLHMNSDTYSALVESEQKKAADAIEAMLAEEGTYLVDIEYDENFRSVTATVDRAIYSSEDRTPLYEAVAVIAPALKYQMFLPNGQRSTVSLVYSDSQEVIIKTTLPMETSIE